MFLKSVSIKKLLTITLSSFLVFSTGCVHPITKDFDSTKKIQVIPVTKSAYIYAQNDSLLSSTLEKELAKMNPDFGQQIKTYNNYMTVAQVGLVVQILSLAACIAANDADSGIAWCGVSISSGLLFSIPFQNKANRVKHKVITDYNTKY